MDEHLAVRYVLVFVGFGIRTYLYHWREVRSIERLFKL